MSGAWTPGPWAVNPKAATNVEAGGRGVSACGGYFDNTSDGAYAVENEANARLIAAAPDMAEALRLFIHYDEATDDDGVQLMLNYADALSAAKAALAKARGEAK